MKKTKLAPIAEEPKTPIVQENTNEDVRHLLVLRNFGKFKVGQIIINQEIVDSVLSSPQKSFVKIRKGK